MRDERMSFNWIGCTFRAQPRSSCFPVVHRAHPHRSQLHTCSCFVLSLDCSGSANSSHSAHLFPLSRVSTRRRLTNPFVLPSRHLGPSCVFLCACVLFGAWLLLCPRAFFLQQITGVIPLTTLSSAFRHDDWCQPWHVKMERSHMLHFTITRDKACFFGCFFCGGCKMCCYQGKSTVKYCLILCERMFNIYIKIIIIPRVTQSYST